MYLNKLNTFINMHVLMQRDLFLQILTLFGKTCINIPNAELQAIAVPSPSMNRSRYDKLMNKTTPSQYGRNANRKPDTPCITAPQLKHIFGPIFEPYLPKIGLNIKSDKFAMPKTNPYSEGLAPLSSASEG